VAFQHVKDGACLKCHEKVGHHVAPAMQPAALFEGARCASCHREHKGTKPTHRDDDGFCVSCHRDIHNRAKGAMSLDVADFATKHPPFRLTVPQGEGVRRVRQDGAAKIVEDTALKFPHAVHLDPQGVKSPAKGRVQLECASCHQPDSSLRMMQPISFEKHCQDCHRLEIEPAVTAREVPHGKPAAAVAMIDEFYANLALKGVRDSFQKAFGVPGEGLLRRVGTPSDAERQDALRLASRKAAKVTSELFEVRVCATCHQVSHDGEWKVAPVRASNRWMPQARFDHKSHAQAKCTTCHDVTHSKLSSDVAMPTIENCRECHGGSRPVEKKVTSNCLLCHGFHDARNPWVANAR
jgi:predicted CXXCH cytochrome family protein